MLVKEDEKKFRDIEPKFRITGVGCTFDRVFPKDFDFQGESHPFVEIVYLSSGNVQITEDEKVYLLGSGDMIIHAPMEFHRIKSYAETQPHVINISVKFSGEMPSEFYEGVFHLNERQHDEFMKCFVKAYDFVTKGENSIDGQLVSDRLGAFLLGLCGLSTERNVLLTDASALLYKKLVRDMQETVYVGISLEKLASQNYISVSYVKKLFRMYANETPKKFYDALRINEATSLLKRGVSITEISEKMNFSSPNFFTVFFKKHMGITPSEYKKSLS